MEKFKELRLNDLFKVQFDLIPDFWAYFIVTPYKHRLGFSSPDLQDNQSVTFEAIANLRYEKVGTANDPAVLQFAQDEIKKNPAKQARVWQLLKQAGDGWSQHDEQINEQASTVN